MGQGIRVCAACGVALFKKRKYCGESCSRAAKKARDAVHSRNRELRSPRRLSRSERQCEVCEITYRPSYDKQRTCSRAHGVLLRGMVPGGKKTIRTQLRGLDHNADLSAGYMHMPPIGTCPCGEVFLRQADGSLPALVKYCPTCRKDIPHRAKANRRARLVGVRREPYQRRTVFEADRWVCQLCHWPTIQGGNPNGNWAPTIDHVLPLAAGGADAPDNLQTAHRWCNPRKKDAVLEKVA